MKQSFYGFNPINMYAGIVGFSCIKAWILIIDKCGILGPPFTRQENTLIQATVLGITGVTSSGGLASYIFGMSLATAKQRDPVIDDKLNIKNPSVGWLLAFYLTTSFVGLFFIVPFERKQVTTFGKFFSFSFIWSGVMWARLLVGDNCGFSFFPLFGFKATEAGFYWDWAGTYVGVGMMCPYSTTISVLIGAIFGYTFMFPELQKKSGKWYTNEVGRDSFHGYSAYRSLVSTAMILGDSVYQILKLIIIGLYRKLQDKDTTTALPVADTHSTAGSSALEIDEQFRTQNFLNDIISTKYSFAVCAALMLVSIIVLPIIFPQVKWYYVVVMYILCPLFAFSKIHAQGATDMTIVTANVGKIAIFIFGSWAGVSRGGIVVALAANGVIGNFVSSASDLMVDFKTGYLTVSSPMSILIGKFTGIAAGCIITPLIFRYFQVTYPDLGINFSTYPVPFAGPTRDVASFALEGPSVLPKYCLLFCYCAFALGIIINIIRDVLPKKWGTFVPIPLIMAVPITIGSYMAVDLCLGSLVALIWRFKNKSQADVFIPIVGSGLICGDGLWTLLVSVFFLINWKPPACVRFLKTQPEE
ncbi:putative metal-nicotianamine transporter ysl7 [Quercus suber]|uniref:Metal-nicotianamine transporter ysl7 n=1 Tax=Quercus suber TaxID=58331 RepID=A0AAW0L434_QUESU